MKARNIYGEIVFGLIEVIFGLATLIAVLSSLIAGVSSKPPEVLIFILVTSVLSLSLGIGILRYNRTSCYLLLYFSTVVILSKILIFAKIIVLSGALETSMPPQIKNSISIVYHGLLLFYFTRPPLKKRFCIKKKNK